MNKVLIIAELVLVKALRSRLLVAMLLLLLPFLIAAWGFEASNPGFQSGFAVDAGGSLIAVFAAVLLLILASEHFYWAGDQAPPTFYLIRAGNRSIYLVGQFIGTAGVMFAGLLLAALSLLLIFRVSSGLWSPEILTTAFMIFLEFSVLGAVLVFLATICSRLLSSGVLLIVYVAGHSLDSLRMAADSAGSQVLTTVLEIFLTMVPDFSLFSYAGLAQLNLTEVSLVVIYALIMVAVYLAAAGIFMQRRDL